MSTIFVLFSMLLIGVALGIVLAIIGLRYFCSIGIHPVVEEGGGSMGDGLRCLLCKREKYPEVFGTACHVVNIKQVRKL